MRTRIAVGVIALIAGSAAGQASRDTVHTGRDGAAIIRDALPLLVQQPPAGAEREGILWTYVDPVSITESVSLGNAGAESWVSHTLNDERISKFTTTGDGNPDFVFSLDAESPFSIGVSAAEAASLCAAIAKPSTAPVTVWAFSDAGGGTPLWTHVFDAAYTNSSKHNVSVSADGARVAALAYDGANSLLVILDGAGAELGSVEVAGFCSGVEISADGSRVVVTAGEYARLYDTATLTEQYALRTSGSGGFHRISRDGTAIAAGGFNIKAAREVGGVWQEVYSGTGTNDWFGWGVALSGDGETLFVLSHDYVQNYLANDHRVVDLTTGTVVAQNGYVGSGAKQNSAVGAQANGDGTLFVAASWGDAGNTQPEVRIYDRDLNLVGSIDTPGSPYDVSMNASGRYVLVGSKAVHANDFGNGGRTYAYETAASCVADFNGDGVVDTRDVIAFLNAWNAQDAASDCDGNGVIDTRDVICFLNEWNAGC
ncbi:MAG TPA: GC-type dockerin domain-anchored protein [Phycisphaerales bacterium]|nr:GC-type dockerin domain-anchored protein [Phycisphaerales bacterium]